MIHMNGGPWGSVDCIFCGNHRINNLGIFLSEKKRLTTGQIRAKVYSRQDGKCLWCDKNITSKQAHLHEVIFRGQGGEISLKNSIILCADCHILSPTGAHGKRRPQWRRNRK